MPDKPEEVRPDKIIFERRKFIRVNGTFVVSYSDVTSQQPKRDISQTKNISLGGLLFTTDREFNPGSVLSVKLRLPESLEYLSLKVQVVDSKPKVKGVVYDTRVKFMGLTDKEKKAIKNIVEHSLQKEKGGGGEG